MKLTRIKVRLVKIIEFFELVWFFTGIDYTKIHKDLLPVKIMDKTRKFYPMS
jgi:hypothetical protein